jgi:hypothetical protein
MAELSVQTDTFGKRGVRRFHGPAIEQGRPMINGGHVIIYSKDSDADRAFLKNILKLKHVDVGHGWLIFALPPSEIAVHPSDANDLHEFYFMCDDLDAEIRDLKKAGVGCSAPEMQGWGRSTRIKLPGGGELGLYQPRHARP